VNLSRRGFFKLTGASFAAGALAELFGPSNAFAADAVPEYRLTGTTESPSICCYCSVGCGMVLSVKDGELVNLEGDPDHPINRGALCSKGNAQFNIRNVYNPETGELELNPYRQTKVKYRAPGASEWEEKDWEWAIDEIAKRVKATRDANYEAVDAKGVTVNRCEAIGNLGGAALDGEEGYAVQKFARALGVTWIEHQARI
jgi:formate dehydrogenase major subunit